MKNILTI